MRRQLLTALITSVSITAATAATAQDYTRVTEPVNSNDVLATINAPIEYDANGVMKTQYFTEADLTPEQLQALLAEADKIRNYRASRTLTQTSTVMASTVDAPTVQTPTVYETAPIHLSSPTYSTQIAPVAQSASPMHYSEPSSAYDSVAPSTAVATGTISLYATHRVQSGDTLYNIARRHGISVTDLQKANGIAGSSIALGQSLTIPTPARSATNPNVQGTTSPLASTQTVRRDGYVTRRVVMPTPDETVTRDVDEVTTSTYAVLRKDTLYSISRRTCVGVKDLIAINGLENPNALSPGQQLSLPDSHCLTR